MYNKYAKLGIYFHFIIKSVNKLGAKLLNPPKVANFATEKVTHVLYFITKGERLMKKILILLVLALSMVSMTVNAQVNDKMEELRSRGFGARNTAAAQVGAAADSVAKAEEAKAQKAKGDTDPSFQGGEELLKAYLRSKLLHTNVSGTGDVVVSFMVDKKGNIYQAEVTQSAGTTLDTAAFNIVTGMPRWNPGLKDGVPVDKPAKVTVSFGKEK